MNNVAQHLVHYAKTQPDRLAVVEPLGYKKGKRQYRTITFRELNEDSDRIAFGLRRSGVEKGMRLAVLVTPGVDFVSCVFGMLKSGAVMILIDPGMGIKNTMRCLRDAEPEGFVAISLVQAVQRLMPWRFGKAKYLLTVGNRWFWGGPSLSALRRMAYPGPFMENVTPDDPAAIIFTTGSTGPPKGVLYQHRTFNTQVSEISRQYNIQPGQTDLPGFPMFGLFNCAMGSTAVIPDLDASRPASVDPKNILEACRDWGVTQSFGSPAIWKVVGQWCRERGETLPDVRMILTAGAPVSEPVMRSVKEIIHPDGEIHTPYGATEALPVATISSTEVLGETAARTREGAGVCVGRKFPSIRWKVIRITDDPIPTLDEVEELPTGQVGELVVSGPQITREYVTLPQHNALSKIREKQDAGEDIIWHRMGDVGYLDEQERFWFCGRKAHRVVTHGGTTLFTIPCEAIFNNHPAVSRSALVGVAGEPVMIVELNRGYAESEPLREELLRLAGSNMLTATIHRVLFHPSFPVDIRHNAKIFREKLALWAAR
ncbi:MAG: fatty acid CoA ligase family protein [Planctomycetia bacterium]|nr:fatty acid CoA ligase family protein [Planctomycetia bacterium]